MLRLSIFGRFSLADDGGTEIRVTSKKGRALLAYLALPIGRARSREEIIALLWSDRPETQGRASLRQELARLKQDLGKDAIKAIRVSGDTVSLDPAIIRLEEGRSGEQLLSGFHLKDEAFQEWLRDERLRLENHCSLPRISAGTIQPERPAIAVLPFKNISGDPEQEYLAEGITEDVITELSRFNSPCQSSGIQSMREKLGVDFIVEGSVRKAGDRIRVTAQLVDIESGKHLWAERYDRVLEDTFETQAELAREIAAVVPRKLDRSATQQARRKHLDELTAYDHFLRAKWFLDRNFSSPEGLAHLNEAIRIDPAFARAHATLADYYAYNHMHTGVLTEDTAMQAFRSAQQALELDPTDPVIHATVAEVYFGSDNDLARHHNELALKLNSNDLVVMNYAAASVSHLGEHDRALDILDRCLRHDPLFGDAWRHAYFHIYYTAKRYKDALGTLKGWFQPPPMVLIETAAALAQLDQLDAARQAAARFEEVRPEGFDARAEIRRLVNVMSKEKDKDNWREGFRKAGFEF